jgi:hypothetical protein
MDHLLAPKNPYRPVGVPFLGDAYDGLDFWAYPESKGRTMSTIFDAARSFDQFEYLKRNTIQGSIYYLSRLAALLPNADHVEEGVVLVEGLAFLRDCLREMRAMGLIDGE